MKKLVQKVIDINPSIESIPSKLQEFLNHMSADGWEYCGQIGMSYVFKRWEEEPVVVQGGNNYGNGNNNYSPYNGNNYRPYNPYYNPNPSFHPYTSPQPSQAFNPSNFGTRVDPADDNRIYNKNPFDE